MSLLHIGENENLVEVHGAGFMRVKVFIKSFLGYDYSFMPYVAMENLKEIMCLCVCVCMFSCRYVCV